MRFVMQAFNGCFLDGAVHAFSLTIGPWMSRFGEAVIDLVLCACDFEAVRQKQLAVIECEADISGG
jgi:hypothetical protein